uniref:SGNH hydrolase-type esterase domain-containing protein n=1 Tax=Oryzias latipes TaxID=8090 RepID=A0A3P9HT38_ORYLA
MEMNHRQFRALLCNNSPSQSPAVRYGGASVKDIHNFLTSKPPSASTLIIHAGTNDIKFQQSETLKADFIHLIHHIQQLNLHCIISGPLPSPRYRDTKFSRIRQLHIWLKSYCHSLNIHYVDNFTAFYNRPNLFKPDGLHPNHKASKDALEKRCYFKSEENLWESGEKI